MRHLAIISEHASPLAPQGSADAGRQSEYVSQAAERAASHGFAVDVFTRRVSPDAPRVVAWRPGVRVIHVDAGPARPMPRDDLLPLMNEFAEWVLGFMRHEPMRYDIVHANYWMSGYVAAIVKRSLGLPFVVTFHALSKVRRMHEGANDEFPTARPIIEERVIQEAETIIATCPQDEQDLCNLYDVSAPRVVTIPCGVDVERFHPVPKAASRTALGLPSKGEVLLTVGRLVAQKGVDDILRALGSLRRKQQIIPQLVIVGSACEPEHSFADLEPEELGRLRRIVREEGVTDQVTFVPSCSDDELRCYYSAADLFVSAPRYEPFGLAVLEAMACGTPVVGTRIGGLKLTVQHGHTGFLVSPQDPAALALAIGRLLRAPEERAAFGRQGLQRARSAFSWADVAGRMSRLYVDVAERSRQARTKVEAPVLRFRPLATAPDFAARVSA